jgi:hypothetical protein
MYSLSDLRRAIDDPILFGRELNRIYHTRLHTREYNPDGVDIFAEDWDNLLILDACRFDVFADVAPAFDLPGTLESRTSRGSSTAEFVKANLHAEPLRDTVYVTATTMLYREGSLNENVDLDLYEIVDVWEDSIDHGEFGVSPESMAEQARETVDEYPDKRVVVHFIQPHIPFIGDTWQRHFADYDGPIWAAKRRGELDASDELLRDAYRENLELVLPHVADLLTTLEGRTVVTADHGQMIGDRSRPVPMKDYGHPSGLYTPELVEVPWLVHQNGPRREIESGSEGADYEGKRTDEIDEKAREHLAHLGYME